MAKVGKPGNKSDVKDLRKATGAAKAVQKVVRQRDADIKAKMSAQQEERTAAQRRKDNKAS